MSYVVLARKYRPPNFQALVGQGHVVQALGNALEQQRLHHAYLFTGTRGVGKTTISRILAKSLNCTGTDDQGGITAHPCGACNACRDIDAGRFIDYVELDAASNRGVEEISQLLDQAVYKPVLGRFKVYMIDEVHMLSTTAFNAMLKTLEEPPEYLKFVLATTDPQKVPATVLSRCLQFNLRPIAPETIQEHLVDVLHQERIGSESGALRLLSRAARGSMRDALSLTDQAIAFDAGTITEVGVRHMLGAVDRKHAVRIVEALCEGDGARLVSAAAQLRSNGFSCNGLLEELAALLQQMAVVQVASDTMDALDPDAPTTFRLSACLAADEIQVLYSIVLHGRAELTLAPDEYSGLVMILLRMLAFKPRAGTAAADTPDGPISMPQLEEARTSHKTPIASSTPQELGDRWSALTAQMVDEGRIGALVRELALQAQCMVFQDSPARIDCRLRVERDMLRSTSHADKLRAALVEIFQRPVTLELEPGAAQDSPAQRAAATRLQRQAKAEETIHADPWVQALLVQYETARIVPGSVKFH
jgi:DNA polymerase III subunit gamma/tau